MNLETFEQILGKQFDRCQAILCSKREEYAQDTDVLTNFKSAAGLRGITPREALAGMMLKHTVSVYDMCAEDQARPIEMWDEKITDHICYLVLLKACVAEEANVEQGLEQGEYF